jgi:hypothetical protein
MRQIELSSGAYTAPNSDAAVTGGIAFGDSWKRALPSSSRSTTRGAITRAWAISTPADIYFGCGPTILARWQNIKRKTIEWRRRLHHQAVA